MCCHSVEILVYYRLLYKCANMNILFVCITARNLKLSYGTRCRGLSIFNFIVVPCFLITLKFLSPTNASLNYTHKLLKYTVRLSHYCSYMFRSTWIIFREPMPNLAKVTNCTAHNTHHSLKHFLPQHC